MARTFVTASSHALSAAAVPATAVPLTLAAWVKTDDNTKALNILQIRTAFTDLFRLRTSIAGKVVAQTGQASVFVTATSSATLANNTWTHVAAVFATASSRIVYVAGVNSGSDSNSSTPSGVNTTDIGSGSDTGATFQVAWPAIWTAALSAGEVAALAAGLDPRLLQSQRAALSDFWPLIGASPEPDAIAAARNFTVTGATRSDDPGNLIYATGRTRQVPPGNRYVGAA